MTNNVRKEIDEMYERYPAHPEEPRSESQDHFDSMMHWSSNLRGMFRYRRDSVAVFCDLAWYPVESDNNIWTTPDIMVVFGVPLRRLHDRQSYVQHWERAVPAVVLELGSVYYNRSEVEAKRNWCQQYGVREFYWINEPLNHVDVFIREGSELVEQINIKEWVSPLLNFRINWSGEVMEAKFSTGAEQEALARQAAEQLAQEERQKVQQFAAFLRQMGVDPNNLPKPE